MCQQSLKELLILHKKIAFILIIGLQHGIQNIAELPCRFILQTVVFDPADFSSPDMQCDKCNFHIGYIDIKFQLQNMCHLLCLLIAGILLHHGYNITAILQLFVFQDAFDSNHQMHNQTDIGCLCIAVQIQLMLICLKHVQNPLQNILIQHIQNTCVLMEKYLGKQCLGIQKIHTFIAFLAL